MAKKKKRKKQKYRKSKRRHPASKPCWIRENLPVLGIEGDISLALAFAFQQRVRYQVKRKMHVTFRNAGRSIIGGRYRHSVVRMSRRSGWMIVDAKWSVYPPKDLIKDAVFKLMAVQSKIQEREAYDLIRSAIMQSFAATKERRRKLSRHSVSAA